MATHFGIFAWGIPQTEEPGQLQSMGSQKSQHNSATKQQQHTLYTMYTLYTYYIFKHALTHYFLLCLLGIKVETLC